MTPPAPADPPADYRDRFEALTGRSLRECPHCRTGVMVVISCVAAPALAYRCQTHHDPGATFQPRKASTPASSGCGCLFRDHRRPAGLRPKAPNPIFSDCSKAQLPGPHSPNHRPECPNVRSTPVPEAFNTHRHDGRGSGLVQDVLRSPARIPAAESRRRGLCAAPANVKRSTLCGFSPAFP
jgi:hypothetical protein